MGDTPTNFTVLRNNYWVLRHGRSIPNERGLIVSSLENGTREEFGLAALGVEQARLAGELFKKEMVELRERYFGTLELLSHDKYAEVWALDEKDPSMPPEGGESVADVASRLAVALLNMETAFQGCAVLIVSHGDTLQILQTLLQTLKENPSDNEDMELRIKNCIVNSVLSQHRKFSLSTGELQQII
ncbi:Phosphoglycerate mutase family protein [Rhynchospora pubera]|uniref:Phosphoglycerate mutase family protein n=1 Tax=Rhynchospora pubera TaxID=906938 RepID=A0AAV8E9N3_9POAL|nr:Phosphoglycerate mutase family protein [Rhynchospora pubera]